MGLSRDGDPVRRSRVKQAVAAVLGTAVALVGVALLVLPGPGFLLVAAGLAILATQFSWARGPLHYARVKAERGVDEVAESLWRTVVAVACGLVPLTTGVLHLVGVRIPVVSDYLNVVTAASLVVSGLFLVGLVVYARRTGGLERRRRQGERDDGDGVPVRQDAGTGS